jgi:ATP-dependent Clp protease adaptor protein ClpS
MSDFSPMRAAQPGKRGDEGGQLVIEKETATKEKTKLKRPKLYKVLLLNDDYTTMEFVVAVLMHIYDKTEAEATAVMLHIHQTGMGVAGVYTYEIAEAKVAETMAAAEEAEYPLMCTIEPDDHDDPDGAEPGGK